MVRWTREALTFSSFIIHSAPRVLLLILSDFDLAIVDFVIPTFRQSSSPRSRVLIFRELWFRGLSVMNNYDN